MDLQHLRARVPPWIISSISFPFCLLSPLSFVKFPLPDLRFQLHLLKDQLARHERLLSMRGGHCDYDRGFSYGYCSQSVVDRGTNQGVRFRVGEGGLVIGARVSAVGGAQDVCHGLDSEFAIRLIVQPSDYLPCWR